MKQLNVVFAAYGTPPIIVQLLSQPHVDKSFPLAQVGEAQSYMEERRNIGKVVLTT